MFARAAVLHCRGCGAPVQRDSPRSILTDIRDAAGLDRLMVTFEVPVPERFTPAEVVALPAGQGYTRVHREHPDRIEVVADRLRLGELSASLHLLCTGRGEASAREAIRIIRLWS